MIEVGQTLIARKRSGSIAKGDACKVLGIMYDSVIKGQRVMIDVGAYALTSQEFTDIFGTSPFYSVYDFLDNTKTDADIYDYKYNDQSVTCCPILGQIHETEYESFCNMLYKKVRFISNSYGKAYADFSGLIETNLDTFREFSEKHWKYQYKEMGTFVREWIKELHLFVAGELPEEDYGTYKEELLSRI